MRRCLGAIFSNYVASMIFLVLLIISLVYSVQGHNEVKQTKALAGGHRCHHHLHPPRHRPFCRHRYGPIHVKCKNVLLNSGSTGLTQLPGSTGVVHFGHKRCRCCGCCGCSMCCRCCPCCRGYYRHPLVIINIGEQTTKKPLPSPTPSVPSPSTTPKPPTTPKPSDKYITLEEAIARYNATITKYYKEVSSMYWEAKKSLTLLLSSFLRFLTNTMSLQRDWETKTVNQTTTCADEYRLYSAECVGHLAGVLEKGNYIFRAKTEYEFHFKKLTSAFNTFMSYFDKCKVGCNIKCALNTSCHLLKDRAKEHLCDESTDPVILCIKSLQKQSVLAMDSMKKTWYNFKEYCNVTADKVQSDADRCGQKFILCLQEIKLKLEAKTESNAVE